MSKFNWTEEDILNSNLTDEYKKILLEELRGDISASDPSNTRVHLQGHLELGRNFRADMRELNEVDPRMVDISLNECLNYNPDDELIINVPFEFLTPDQLASEVLYFFKTLDDEDIYHLAEELMNPNNGHLKIESTEDFPICDEIRGRCIKDPYQDVIFASYYMRKSLIDFPILAHETAHMLSAKLFDTRINPLVKNYLSELEAYYFELLCGHYIDSVTTQEDLRHITHNMRVIKSIDYMWMIRKQYLLSRHLIKPSAKRLNQELSQIPNSDRVTPETLQELYRFRTWYVNNMIHSILAAIDLYYVTIEDKEKGLRLFKDMMTSTKDNIRELYHDANITYLDDDCANFKRLHEKTKALKKIANQ